MLVSIFCDDRIMFCDYFSVDTAEASIRNTQHTHTSQVVIIAIQAPLLRFVKSDYWTQACSNARFMPLRVQQQLVSCCWTEGGRSGRCGGTVRATSVRQRPSERRNESTGI